MKERFDVAVIVPLEEEFDTALTAFSNLQDRSTPTQMRFAASVPGSDITILLVKQHGMGKTECVNACTAILQDFDVGMLVCLGIAGGLAADVNIGDICYTNTMIDLADNVKITEEAPQKPGKGIKRKTKPKEPASTIIGYSPNYYDTPREIGVALGLDRTSPEFRQEHSDWLDDRERFGREQIPEKFPGKEGQEEIVRPAVRDGYIACGHVSDSKDYNKQIKGLNRKVLAIETESGAMFSIAKQASIPALAVRGISDYAGMGVDKHQFEKQTNNKARFVAASNAAFYLARQLGRPALVKYLKSRRTESKEKTEAPATTPAERLAGALLAQSKNFDGKLRDLSPAYGLQHTKDYSIPLPRVKIREKSISPTSSDQGLSDIRDALKTNRVLIVQIPPQYPDRSLAWIIARDFLSAQTGNAQVVPNVIEASDLHIPKRGIMAAADPAVLQLYESGEAEVVFVIDEFSFESRSQTQFLLGEVKLFDKAKFIIVTRNKSNIIQENEFVRETSAAISVIDEISFLELSHFLQKNFGMDGASAEVVAARLHETFQEFKLSAHPSYFAGIAENVLLALLKANRRAELLELAVAGYLSYVVSQDDDPISLSRTTREQFLTLLAYEMRVEKKSFDEVQLTAFTQDFANRFDFNISPAKFVASFIAKGILYVDGGKVKFTLPFMESYLLAKRLYVDHEASLNYFEIGDPSFDFPTFAIFAELGVPPGFIHRLTGRVDQSIVDLSKAAVTPPLIMGDKIHPQLLAKQDRVAAIQKQLQQAVVDVTNNNDQSKEKQRMLDAARRMEERTSEAAYKKTNRNGEARRTMEGDAMAAWYAAVTLLGAGAERLEATTKRNLVAKIIRLSSLIIDDWTRQAAALDYAKLKAEMREDADLINSLAKENTEAGIARAKRFIDGMMDIIEFMLIAQGFRTIAGILCEEARDSVLAESIVNTDVGGGIEPLLRSLWLSDVDTMRGAPKLREAVKEFPSAMLLRVLIATHLMERVYWKHWDKESRLKLLTLAQESLEVVGLKYDKATLQRMIEEQEKKE